ncbi:LuxR C-terminal-related transcriptional regulator [Streptomyces lavendulae]|uniref:LuxR C-terminal-related transcriptional regulator n=2 Tax=Streptomyces lavendulae TaxID=1914 RepID=UPI003D7F52B0
MTIAGTLAQGMKTAKAAAELSLSEGTVAIQMSHGNRRAGVRHRHALVPSAATSPSSRQPR